MWSLKKLYKKLGPGFITGASDDDPSGIATYTQVGAQFGLKQLWTALLMLPFMIAIQEMIARVTMVAGQALTAIMRRHYPRWIVWIVVLMIFLVNTINIGANLGAMADATKLILPDVPFVIYLIGYSLLILFLEIFLTYKTYAKVLKWLAFSLFSYMITAFIVTTDWGEVLYRAIVPTLEINRNFILAIVAVFGTTISPYLFFWQSNEEIEEEIVQGRKTIAERKGATKTEIKDMRMDVSIGMIFSNLMTFFIITTAAMTFFKRGITDIQSSAMAAQALEPLAGKFASLIFAVGIIGTGLLAVPVLSATASYALAEAFGWKSGLYKKLREAHGFYGAITLSTLVGLIMNFTGINPIKLLFYTAVLNGIIAPFLIAVIIHIANNKKIMGKHRNGIISNLLGLTLLIFMTLAVIMLFAIQ
ncbi:MAG: Nramp family divalent metal transporter [Patescibacteria group bacterium]